MDNEEKGSDAGQGTEDKAATAQPEALTYFESEVGQAELMLAQVATLGIQISEPVECVVKFR